MPARSRNALHALRERIVDLSPGAVDELYGLEPLFEPGLPHPEAAREVPVAVQCPWCRERHDLVIDPRRDGPVMLDACRSCTRALQLSLDIGDNGALRCVEVRRFGR
jgi:hypothetical protein